VVGGVDDSEQVGARVHRKIRHVLPWLQTQLGHVKHHIVHQPWRVVMCDVAATNMFKQIAYIIERGRREKEEREEAPRDRAHHDIA